MRGFGAVLLAAMLAATGAKAAESKMFRDWMVSCDNLRTCAAFGSASQGAGELAYIRIGRDGAPAAAPRISIVHLPGDTPTAATWTLRIDGKPIPGLAAVRTRLTEEEVQRVDFTPAQTAALLAAVRNGQALQIVTGRTVAATISLAGVSASLLYMDEQQQRLDTTTAFIRRGARPASAIPAVPLAPLVTPAAAVPQDRLPRKTPAAVLSRLRDCDDDLNTADLQPQVARLAPDLLLWSVSCSRGAYNFSYGVFTTNERGTGVRAISLPLPAGSEEATDSQPYNVEYDAASRVFTSFYKGRGFGDCGVETQWVWDGRNFQLLGQKAMDACLGVLLSDWPSTYRARIR